ncbi:MAG TPA: MauE/DoxX family redox-associated membrane protein [Thermoanaerobaculia bacterium]|nr:MauE/DoxX family redox-associated membrane protein [Thermoanaerobaculia bacterium]
MEAIETTANVPAIPRLSSHPIWWWLGTFGGAFLGGVLLVAVWAKALDPAAFMEQIHGEGLDGFLPAQAVALIALAIEAAFGLALLLGVRRLWVLVPASLLVAFFLSLTGRSWWLAAHGLRSESASCGCFGNLVQRTPSEAFWQDLALLVPALLVAYVGRERGPRFPLLRTVVAVVGAAVVALFAWKSPALPLDDLATRLRPGAVTKDFCAGADDSRICLDSLVPELKAGRHLVVMAKLDDPQFTKAVDDLNHYAGDHRNPTLWVLFPITPEEKRAFFWKWGPAFEVREAPQELLRPLYRRLPRSFIVENGKVTRTFGGLPPSLIRSERSST